MDKEFSKLQDKQLLDTIEVFFDELIAEGAVPIAGYTRVHERNIQVAFKDGRVVTLVLYGPRGK